MIGLKRGENIKSGGFAIWGKFTGFSWDGPLSQVKVSLSSDQYFNLNKKSSIAEGLMAGRRGEVGGRKEGWREQNECQPCHSASTTAIRLSERRGRGRVMCCRYTQMKSIAVIAYSPKSISCMLATFEGE